MTMENPKENEGVGAIVWAMGLILIPILVLALGAITGCVMRRLT